MTPDDAKNFFSTQAAIARVLGISAPAVSEWFDVGRIPIGRQYQLELASGGRLKADLPPNRISVSAIAEPPK